MRVEWSDEIGVGDEVEGIHLAGLLRRFFLCQNSHVSLPYTLLSTPYPPSENTKPRSETLQVIATSRRKKVAFISNGPCTARYSSGVDNYQSWLCSGGVVSL